MSPVDRGKKNSEASINLASNLGGVVSPNQGFRQRNNCLLRLNEDKGFFSKFILVKRQREG